MKRGGGKEGGKGNNQECAGGERGRERRVEGTGKRKGGRK